MKIKEIRSNLQIKITLLIFILLLSISVLVSAYLGISAESRAKEIANPMLMEFPKLSTLH